MNAAHGLSAVESAALTRRVTLYSVATAAVLVAIKIAAWLASGSIALLASTADSGLDLLASLTTFFAVRYAVAPPDAEHRYGHGKAEGFASLVQAGLVFASAALIAREDRKSTRLNSSHQIISYAVFCLKKKKVQALPLHPATH